VDIELRIFLDNVAGDRMAVSLDCSGFEEGLSGCAFGGPFTSEEYAAVHCIGEPFDLG